MKAKSRIDAIAAWFRPRAAAPAGRGSVFLAQRERFARAQALITAFYAVLMFFALSNLFSWQEYLNTTSLTPRWPVFWLRYVELRSGIAAILWFHLVAGLLAVTLSNYRFARILVFCSWLEFLAFRYSFGGINHGDHLGLLLSFVLIFLPSGWNASRPATRYQRAATLLVFSGCQALIMLTYSMSGAWKAGGVIQQALQGETTYLAPSGLARQVAAKLLADDATSILGPWLIEHYWVGWPLMIGALYLELFALWAAARPSLHRAWGLALIFLHVSTHLTMGVGFPQNPLWLALFLLVSPFRPESPSWRQLLRDLPVIGRWLPAVSVRGS